MLFNLCLLLLYYSRITSVLLYYERITPVLQILPMKTTKKPVQKPRFPKTYRVSVVDYVKAKKRCERNNKSLSDLVEKFVCAVANNKTIVYIQDENTFIELHSGSISLSDTNL